MVPSSRSLPEEETQELLTTTWRKCDAHADNLSKGKGDGGLIDERNKMRGKEQVSKAQVETSGEQ